MKKILSLFVVLYFALAPVAYGVADVAHDATLPTSLVSYWTLDEASGTRVDTPGTYDLADNNSTGALSGANCKQGGCADFTPNDNLSIAEQTEFVYNGSTNRSVSFCFYADSVTGVQGLVGMYGAGTATGENWLVYLNGTSLILLARNQGAAVTYGSAISTGTWYHVVATMDSSNNYQLIVNDGTPGTGGGGTGTGTESLVFRIGAYGITSTGYFNGRIDEVGFWTKKLSATEITTLYNSSSCLPYDAGTPASTGSATTVIFE